MGWKDAPIVGGEKWKDAPIVSEMGQGAQPSPQPQRVQDRAKDIFGFKDYETRGAILPFGRTKGGNLEIATPQVAVDMLTSALLPGHVAQGGEYTPQDVAKFTLDYAAPATARAGMVAKPKVPTKRQFVANAPTTKELAARSSDFYDEAAASGLVVKPTSYDKLLDDMAALMAQKGFDEDLHPAAAAAYKALSKKRGIGNDVGGLDIAYKQLGDARGAPQPGTRRVAGIMQDALNDYVERLGPNDVAAGDVSSVASDLATARNLWARSRKSETIEKMVDRASRQASGFENGLRIEMRRLLNNENRLRGFSPDERNLMREIEKGGTPQKIRRLLAKLSYVKSGAGNLVGGSIGAGGGAAIGSALAGPAGAWAGAAIPPVVGYGAQKAAEKSAMNQAALLRAMAATGKRPPTVPIDQRTLARMLELGVGPVVGAGGLNE